MGLKLLREPCNAEPPRQPLVSSYVTPVDLFYKRNHGPVPVVDDIERKLPKYNIVATLQCAGNRRTAMSKTKTVKDIGWDVAAIGNAVWGGAKLVDVLELVGIQKSTIMTPSGGKQVEFVSIDVCKEEHGGPYKASIPLYHATNPEADVLLAYEMNGERSGISTASFVAGVIGARSVKWLDSIKLIAEECKGFFMQRDYKMFPPSVNWDNINWSTRRPQMDFPVQARGFSSNISFLCAICSLEDVNVINSGKVRQPAFASHNVKVSGYAVSGDGRGIERIDISADGGKTWIEASRYQMAGTPYDADDIDSDKWAWVLFETHIDVSQSTEIVAKAVDSAGNVQPENVEVIWNLRGILNTSWHRFRILG
ncbi:Oxidoreductase, molybdopterin-binding domain [Dillenia turbinata]|uniref:Sulfite oxidase n=1 Tax=Dillenia turbinata TaxID=194707 RepID=A0AAN8Z6N9_9MAGN